MMHGFSLSHEQSLALARAAHDRGVSTSSLIRRCLIDFGVIPAQGSTSADLTDRWPLHGKYEELVRVADWWLELGFSTPQAFGQALRHTYPSTMRVGTGIWRLPTDRPPMQPPSDRPVPPPWQTPAPALADFDDTEY